MNMFALCKSMDAPTGARHRPDRRRIPLPPVLIHAAQPHHGTTPRFIAQPPLMPVGLLDLARPNGAYSPVEHAVRLGLGYPTRPRPVYPGIS